MSDSFYTIRNYRPADFEKYVRLNTEAARLEPTEDYPAPLVLRERLNRPNYSPEQDLFIAENAANIVGYLEVTLEVKIGRVILNCFIHPDHRRQGLASKLFGYATHRTQEVGAKVAHVNVPPDNVVAQTVLSKLGFRSVRRFLELKLDITKVGRQDTDPARLHYRHLQRGEENQLTQLQNRCFAGTWGYNPNTTEEIVYCLNLNHGSPDDVVLAYDGDKIAGYCWARITYPAATAASKGQIFMLGVDPDYRGRGIGKGVLRAGLSYLRSKGLHVAELTVDSRNQAAGTLYRSLGFKVWTSRLWYERVID